MFVGVEGHGVALDLHLDRHDLLCEPAIADGFCRALLAFHGKGVLRFAADVMLARDILGRDAHVAGAEGAVERAQHHVERADVAHLGAPALVRDDEGRARHVLGAARQREIGVAQHQGLHRRDDGLRAGPAEPVDVHRGGGVGNARLHRGDPAQVHVARFCVDDVAKDHVADLVSLDARALQRGFGDNGAQRDGRGAGETAAESADGGARGAQDDDIVGHGGLLSGLAGLCARASELSAATCRQGAALQALAGFLRRVPPAAH